MKLIYFSDDSGDKNVQRDAHDIHDFAPDADLDPSFLDGNEKRKRWWNRKETKKVKEPVVDAVSEDERFAINCVEPNLANLDYSLNLGYFRTYLIKFASATEVSMTFLTKV